MSVYLCTAGDPSVIRGTGYWISPDRDLKHRKLRPAGLLDPPEGLLPSSVELLNLDRRLFNPPLFERLYFAQLLADDDVNLWVGSLPEGQDLTFVCLPHAPSRYCHRHALGTFVRRMRPELTVQDLGSGRLDEQPISLSHAARLFDLRLGALRSAAARGDLVVQRGEPLRVGARPARLTTRGAVRAYLERRHG